MEGKEDFKKHADNMLSGIEGIMGMAKKAIDTSLQELAKADPVKAKEQAEIYAKALGSGGIDKGFENLGKQFAEMKGVLNGL